MVVPINWPPKFRRGGENDAVAGRRPVPLSGTDCGLPDEELSLSVSPPLRVPKTVGVNVTFIVQYALAPTELPQSLVCAKSPLVVIEFTVRGTLPVLLSRTM